jgi:hypothetical protein
MALTSTQALDQIRQFLNEPVSVFWTDGELAAWLAEGCRDFSSKSLMVEETLDITLVAGQIRYTAVDNAALSKMIEPYACLYNDGTGSYKGILKVHPRLIGNESVNSPGDPRYYALHHSTLWIWPAPTAPMVAAGAALKILYSQVTDNIEDIHYEYQHLPMLYAKAMAKYKDQKFSEGNALMTLYMSSTSFERQDKHAREEDTLDMFKVKKSGGQQGAQ